MSALVIGLVKLTEEERRTARDIAEFMSGGPFELLIRGRDGDDLQLELPRSASSAVRDLLVGLASGEGVAILAESRELSPNEAAQILGISRPLVVHRMDIGDLPFRYVGKHRRAKLRDVLRLKEKLEGQRQTLNALREETERLIRDHDL